MGQVALRIEREMRAVRGAVETLRCLGAAIEITGLLFLGVILSVGLYAVW